MSFVLLMQSDWMYELALQITSNLAWAIDSTFKTNHYGISMYVAMCINAVDTVCPFLLYFVPKITKKA